jgi:hypothetical protein
MPLAAHHSTRGAFDDSKLITMQGTVTEIRWMNPHARLFMEVTGAGGNVANWEIEMASPNVLGRQGLKRDTFKPGDRVLLDVWLARVAPYMRNLATMRSLMLPDGRVISGQSAWDNPIKLQ